MNVNCFAAAASLAAGVSVAFAGPVNVGKVVFGNGPGGLLGEINGSKNQLVNFSPLGITAGQFETFCLEEFETIDYTNGTVYDVDKNDRTVATNSAYNGGAHGGSQDPISDQTAWLYRNFILQTLPGYDYGAGRANSADALQVAIWALEEERAVPGLGQPGRAFIDAANDAVNNKGFKNDGSVVVLNVYIGFPSGERIEHQDVLALIVPLPSAAGAGLTTIGGLCFLRRRRA